MSEFKFGTWYPIETAPKDGSMIILGRARKSEDDWEMSTIGWHVDADEDGPDYMGHDAGFVDYSFNNFNPGRSFGSDISKYKASEPTHWMPLPPPPQEKGE